MNNMPFVLLKDPLYSVKTITTRKFLKEAKAKGQIKRCAGCRRKVGKSYEFCGECVSKRSTEAIAAANGINLRKGKELSAEHKANIAAANKRRAK